MSNNVKLNGTLLSVLLTALGTAWYVVETTYSKAYAIDTNIAAVATLQVRVTDLEKSLKEEIREIQSSDKVTAEVLHRVDERVAQLTKSHEKLDEILRLILQNQQR